MMRSILIAIIVLFVLAGGATVSPLRNVTATQPREQDAGVAQESRPTGVIRLSVRIDSGDGAKSKGLARKRFFLITGSLKDNEDLMRTLAASPVISRKCYYESIHASAALIDWLERNDCETVYCREVDAEDVTAVPEFAKAVETGEKEHKSRLFAFKWLTVNLSDDIRNGFYKKKQQDLQAALLRAEQVSKNKVMSAMTDGEGIAYFTDVLPGTYLISNIQATELRNSTEFWSCEVEVKPGDLNTATIQKPYLIVNPRNKAPRDAKHKCISRTEPLPKCD